jgi:ABC-type uncharacterized transport system permease subunit
MKSKLFRINKKDILRGFGIAASAALTYLFALMCTGIVPDMGMIKGTASVFVGSGGSYILKNFFTNSNDQFFKKESGDDNK